MKHVIDSLGKEITIDADYYYYKNGEDQDLTVTSRRSGGADDEKNRVNKNG